MRAVPEETSSLLILPGSLCDKWVYAAQIAALSRHCSVVVPNPGAEESIEEMADAVLKDAPPRFALVGHALGGRIALEVIRREPERVRALALLATTVHPVRPGEGARRQTQIDLAMSEGMGALAGAWLPKVLHPRSLADPALMQGMTEMYCRFTPEDYAREVRALLKRPDPRAVLERINCPALVLSGRDDPLCSPEQSQALASQIKNAAIEIVDGCAHFPSIEQPESVTAALLRWAAQARGSAPASFQA